MAVLYASFGDAALAEKAAGALMDHGARAEDISVVANDEYGRTRTDNATTDPNHSERAAKEGISTTTAADAGAGAAKGAGIGLALGVAGGLASLLIPGVGLVVGSGALATAIGAAAGTTVAGAITGGVTGYLADQGMPQQVAADYDKAIKNGGALLSVNVPSNTMDALTAQDILTKYDGVSNVRTY